MIEPPGARGGSDHMAIQDVGPIQWSASRLAMDAELREPGHCQPSTGIPHLFGDVHTMPIQSAHALWSAAQRFVRDTAGVVALEGAIAIMTLVLLLAVSMAWIHTLYVSDQVSAATQAVAATLAVNPHADPCLVAHQELRGFALPDAISCERIQVVVGTDLADLADPKPVPGGQFIVVRISYLHNQFARRWISILTPGSGIETGAIARLEPFD